MFVNQTLHLPAPASGGVGHGQQLVVDLGTQPPDGRQQVESYSITQMVPRGVRGVVEVLTA